MSYEEDECGNYVINPNQVGEFLSVMKETGQEVEVTVKKRADGKLMYGKRRREKLISTTSYYFELIIFLVIVALGVVYLRLKHII